MANSIEELLVGIWFFGLTKADILQWADQYISDTEEVEPEIYELFNSNIKQSENLLLALIQKNNKDFSRISEQSEILVAKLLLNKLSLYLLGETMPLFICDLIQRIESNFLGAPRANLERNTAYYPVWLGDLVNACDWCDASWNYLNSTELNKQIELQIQIISAWLYERETEGFK